MSSSQSSSGLSGSRKSLFWQIPGGLSYLLVPFHLFSHSCEYSSSLPRGGGGGGDGGDTQILQNAESQSSLTAHLLWFSHGVHPPPQSVSVSTQFAIPSKQVARGVPMRQRERTSSLLPSVVQTSSVHSIAVLSQQHKPSLNSLPLQVLALHVGSVGQVGGGGGGGDGGAAVHTPAPQTAAIVIATTSSKVNNAIAQQRARRVGQGGLAWYEFGGSDGGGPPPYFSGSDGSSGGDEYDGPGSGGEGGGETGSVGVPPFEILRCRKASTANAAKPPRAGKTGESIIEAFPTRAAVGGGADQRNLDGRRDWAHEGALRLLAAALPCRAVPSTRGEREAKGRDDASDCAISVIAAPELALFLFNLDFV